MVYQRCSVKNFAMASVLDMSAFSDSEDDDYVPPQAASDSSCEDEIVSGDELNSGELRSKANTKEGQHKALDKDVESNSATKVDEKKRSNDLWESFLSDVESVTPKKSDLSPVNNTTLISNGMSESKTPKIDTNPVSKVFEFAGETITVNSCDSAREKSTPVNPNQKAPAKRGIDSVLGTIMNKNKKITVLEKSRYDWDTFKKDEGLDNELEKFNKGKQGFIERQRFLERSDLRSFEKEKSMRQILRKK